MEATTDNQNMGEILAPKRPQFLTVLCVLSFIMCGFGLLSGIYGIIKNTPENMQESIERVREMSPEMADTMEQQMIAMQESTYGQISPYLNFVWLLLSFLGVFMMWKLQKKGFYIYIAGELLPYIAMLAGGKEAMAMMGGMGGGMIQGAVMIMMILMFIFDAAFIVMYGMNLKHMK
jgi:hypothetical protein